MAYATLNQLKSALRIGTADTMDDENLELALNSAGELINVHCGRTFGTVGSATLRVYAPGLATVAEIDDTTTVTAVEWSQDGSSWTAMSSDQYQLEPLNRTTDGMTNFPYTRVRAINSQSWPVYAGVVTLRVTGVFCFGSIPSAVTQANVMQSSRLFARLSSPLGVAGFNEGIGAVQVRSGLDVDVQQLLQPYVKFRAAL